MTSRRTSRAGNLAKVLCVTGDRTLGESKMNEEDLSLVRSILQGDETAFRKLVEKYQRIVYNIVWRMVRNDEDARDLTQEAFIRVHRALRTFDTSRTFSTWLYRIATNLCIDHHRKRRLRTLSIDAEPAGGERREPLALPDEGPAPDRLHETKSLAQRIDALLEKLSPTYRAILHLRYREQLSYEEMAEVLETPLGTVKARLHRAHRKLRELLETEGPKR
ncbi:MAG: sigma-70 family RNA polymerase sigma factor [Candidatus Eisenbacteria bacterium]|nr:sigma-70 family RNA polymerase sigma factor [Candidatus Eisenbacteria bacterium]